MLEARQTARRDAIIERVIAQVSDEDFALLHAYARRRDTTLGATEPTR